MAKTCGNCKWILNNHLCVQPDKLKEFREEMQVKMVTISAKPKDKSCQYWEEKK